MDLMLVKQIETMMIKNNRNKYIFKALLAICICIGLGSTLGCKKSSNKVTPVCDGTNATYNSTVKAIVNNSCVSCHSSYSTYAGLTSVTSNGKFKNHVLTDQDMPKGGSLSSDQLNKIQCWADNGYPEN